jgi:lipopolysaccharide assembly outer membrane protein LptD (OstA)
MVLTAPGRAQAPAPTPALPIEISGATYLEYNDQTGVLVAKGAPVVVTRGQTTARAPRFRYEQRDRRLVAEEGVELTDRGLVLQAQTAELRLTDDFVRARGDVRIHSTREGQTATLAAPQVEGSLRTRRFTAFEGVTVTRGEWTLTGQRVNYDDATRTAIVTGAPQVHYKNATMTADLITLLVADEVARAEGNVRLRRGNLTARAPRADVFGRTNLAVLSGGVQAERGTDRLTADIVEVDMATDRVTARGSSRLITESGSP